MREVTYTDKKGFKYQVLVPDNAPDSAASKGIRIGPPDFGELDLSLRAAVRLNNDLHARGLITYKDVKSRQQEVVAALQAAFRVDAIKITELYFDQCK
jgi:hypothetical protein